MSVPLPNYSWFDSFLKRSPRKTRGKHCMIPQCGREKDRGRELRMCEAAIKIASHAGELTQIGFHAIESRFELRLGRRQVRQLLRWRVCEHVEFDLRLRATG